MALNFPDNPTPGQQYTDPNNLIWEFNGVVWTPITGAVGISGFSGFSGYSGYSGTSGYSGISGISGFSGTGSAISASDEGNLLTNTVSSFNFVGTNVVATNVGGAVTLTVNPPVVYNNSAWAWGAGNNGVLGDGTTGNKSSPVSVVGGFTDWCQIAGGGGLAATGHSHAVRTNGTLWSWGFAGGGVLGDNTIANKSSPVSVVGGFTDWCQVAANRFGPQFASAVRQNGTAWAWGCNNCGQLGDNTTVSKSSPVSVVGGFTDWCQVSAGAYSMFGLRTNGTVWAWGSGSLGRLGDGTTVSKSSPVSVVGGFTDWCQISAGFQAHSLAVRQNGTAWAWGRAAGGGLGNNTATGNKSSPVSVVGGFTDWCQVSAGKHSAGVRQDGTAWAWGYADYGSLGDGTTVNKSSPVSVVGGFTDWCQVSAGYRTSLAVRQNGTVWAWGYNNSGRLGTNNTTNRSSPVSVVGGFTDWCQVDSAYGTSAGIRSTAT